MTRKPQTTDEILEFSTADFREIDDWLWRGDLSAKYLIKDLIRILDGELEWRGREDSMSLRGLWYSGVKTALQNAFPNKWNDPEFDANRRYTQYLSEHLSDMVKDGEVTYRQLNIVDDSRQRDIARDTIEDDKILFVEKEAAYRRLLPIQRVFEISLVSGGGWEATALIEDLANTLESGQDYQLFVLSDFDPTGYRIAEDFETRAQTLGVNITDVERIGIEPEQVSDRVREQERFQVPRENDYDERWLREHGIDGRYGLELEAIGDVGEGGRPLREIIVEAMRPHLRFRDRQKADAEWALQRTAYFAVDRLVDNLTENLRRQLLTMACSELGEIEGVVEIDPNHPPGGVIDNWAEIDAEVELDEYESADGEYWTEPLSEEAYVENAVEAPTDDDGDTDVVTPKYWTARKDLKDDLMDSMEDGDVDVMQLLGLGGDE